MIRNKIVHPFLDIGIAYTLNKETIREAFRLIQIISERVSTISQLDESHLTHITLFQGRFPMDTKVEIKKRVESICKSSGMVIMNMTNYLFIRPNRNVFWNVLLTPELKALHLKIQKHLLPLTKGMIMDQFQDLFNNPELSWGDREQISKYGALLAGEKYLPHLTLCKLANKNDQDRISDIKPKPITFTAKTMIGGKLGYFGDLKEELFSIKL